MSTVIHNQASICTIGASQIEELKSLALSLGKSCRICMHTSSDNPIQEMIIAHTQGTYIRPHRHDRCTTSYHMIDGEIDMFIFSESGAVIEKVSLSSDNTLNPTIVRLNQSFWYMPVIKSAIAVFHEVLNGPFVADKSTQWAQWSPDCSDIRGIEIFLNECQKFTK